MLMVADLGGRGVSGMLTSALVLKNTKCNYEHFGSKQIAGLLNADIYKAFVNLSFYLFVSFRLTNVIVLI